jgi:hypothetical protein
MEMPRCKRDVQKLLGKVNYLRRFITNLAGKVDSFLPLVQLKHENGFIWGEEQRKAFEKIKKYLTSPPVLQAPRAGKGFRLYIAAQEHVIGAALTQSDEGKEFVVEYLSQSLKDVETRFKGVSHIVKQKNNEGVGDYMRRFRDVRNKCYRLTIREKDLTELAFAGLTLTLMDKMNGLDFADVNQVLQRAMVCENRAKDNKSYSRFKEVSTKEKPGVNYVDKGSSNEE